MGLKALKKLGRKLEGVVKTGTGDYFGLGKAGDELSNLLTPDINIPAPKEPKVMPIPDEELAMKQRRRLRSKRKGGRSSTILSQEDTLG